MNEAAAAAVRHPARAVLALALAAGLAGGGWWASGRYREWRERAAADRALAGYDFDAAGGHLAACLDRRPHDPALLLLAARTARRAGRLDEAQDLLHRLRDAQQRPTPESALERALLAAQRGRLAEVEADLRARLDRHDPASARILEALALGAVEAYRLDDAFAWLKQLVDLEPDNALARLTAGGLFEVVGSVDVALAEYRRAVEDHPDLFGARLRLAGALSRFGKAEEASGEFETLRRARPDDPAVLRGLARCHVQLGRPGEAAQLLDGLLAGAPDDAEALVERGKLALDANDLARAEGCLRRAVRLQPFDRQANFQLAACLQRSGHPEEAKPYLDEVRRIEADLRRLEVVFAEVGKTKDPAPRLEMARLCMRNGQEGEAVRWLYSVLQADPKRREAHEALADYFERHGRSDAAAEHRRQAQGR